MFFYPQGGAQGEDFTNFTFYCTIIDERSETVTVLARAWLSE